MSGSRDAQNIVRDHFDSDEANSVFANEENGFTSKCLSTLFVLEIKLSGCYMTLIH